MNGGRNTLISIAAILMGIFAVSWLVSQDSLHRGAEWLSRQGGGGVGSAFILALTFAFLATFMVPSSLMKLLCGAILGFGWGTMAAWMGSMLGAIPGFYISRRFTGVRFEAYLKERPLVEAVEEAVVSDGLRTMIIARLSLILPYNILNYALGTTRMRSRDYHLGNLATIGPSILYAWWGSQMLDVAEVAGGVEKDGTWWIIMICSLLLTIYLILHTRKLTLEHLTHPSSSEGE